MCCCCCEEGDCCEYGFFAHAFVLCLTAGFALSPDVCECTIPGFSYTSAPGVIHKQCLCYYQTKSWTPVPTVPVNFWCLCNLCLCGFDFGNYCDTSPTPPSEPTMISAPIPQMVSRMGSRREFEEADHRQANLSPPAGSSRLVD